MLRKEKTYAEKRANDLEKKIEFERQDRASWMRDHEKYLKQQQSKMEDALDIIESLAAEEKFDLCVYQENALAFINKWANPPHFLDVVELYPTKEAIGSKP